MVSVDWSMPMANASTKAFGKMDPRKATAVVCFFHRAIIMKENIKIIYAMDRAGTNGKMDACLLATTRMICVMDEASLPTRPETSTMACFFEDNGVAMVDLSLREAITKENGRPASIMVEDDWFGDRVLNTKENFRREPFMEREP